VLTWKRLNQHQAARFHAPVVKRGSPVDSPFRTAILLSCEEWYERSKGMSLQVIDHGERIQASAFLRWLTRPSGRLLGQSQPFVRVKRKSQDSFVTVIHSFLQEMNDWRLLSVLCFLIFNKRKKAKVSTDRIIAANEIQDQSYFPL